MGNAGGLIAAIFISSLFVSSFFISYFNIGFNGDNRVQIIKLPTTFYGGSDNYNFKQSCSLSSYTTTGNWICDNLGLTLNGAGSLKFPLSETNTKTGIYRNDYKILNATKEYYVIVTDSSVSDYIHVKVKPDGLYIPSTAYIPLLGTMETGTAIFVPITGALSNTITTITTEYDVTYDGLTITFNGIVYPIDQSKLPPNYWSPDKMSFATGIVSTDSLSIETINSNFQPLQSSIVSTIDGLKTVLNLIWSMLTLSVYSFPYDIIPLEWQILLIFPQEFMIVVGLAMFIRG